MKLEALQTFVFQLAKQSPDPRDDLQIAALMHLVDHLDRLAARRRRAVARTELVREPRLAQTAGELAIELSRAPAPVESPESLELARRLRAAAKTFELVFSVGSTAVAGTSFGDTANATLTEANTGTGSATDSTLIEAFVAPPTCLMVDIFADGFETGDTSCWSETSP